MSRLSRSKSWARAIVATFRTAIVVARARGHDGADPEPIVRELETPCAFVQPHNLTGP